MSEAEKPPVSEKAVTDNTTRKRDKRPLSHRAQIVTAIATVLGAYSIWHALRNEGPRDAEDCLAKLYPMDVQLNGDLAHYPKAWQAFDHDPEGNMFTNLDETNFSVLINACESFGDEIEPGQQNSWVV
jgi:hypothetical protein